MARHIATKQEILDTIPGKLTRASIHGRLALQDVKHAPGRFIDSLVDPEYYPPSETRKAHIYASRVGDLLLAKNIECPGALREIIDHRGSTDEFPAIQPDLPPEAA